AKVEVDGRPAPVTDGTAEVRGLLGTMHHVRVVKGSQEATAEVVITTQGPMPARVQIDASGAKAAGPSPSGTAVAAAASAKAGTKAPPSGKPAASSAPEAPPPPEPSATAAADAVPTCTRAAKGEIVGKVRAAVIGDASMAPGDYTLSVHGGT